MKKYLVLLLAIMLCICISACSKGESESDTKTTTAKTTTTEVQTTAQRVTSTTALNQSEEKSEQLKSDIEACFEDGVSINTTETGGFELLLDDTDEAQMYSAETSDDLQKAAEDNATALVKAIEENYPYELTYESTNVRQIGSSDNGVDSAVYIIVYTNTQNQLLEIHADSTGSIYYVYCDFTW